MKKLPVLIVSMFIAISLCACTSTSTTYVVEQDGTTYGVDTVKSTIFDGVNKYQYSFSGNSSSYSVYITYPDGSTYWWQQQDYSGHGGWSDNYDENRYVAGHILRDILEEKAPKESNTGNFFIAIFLLGIGILYMASPYTAWYLQYGWIYKDAEPSDVVLTMYRILGGVAIVIAVTIFSL